MRDESRVTLENLNTVVLEMSTLSTTRSPDFPGITNSTFSISAEVIQLFYQAKLSGSSTLDVQANLITTSNYYNLDSVGWYFDDNSSFLLNVNLLQHDESEFIARSCLSFHDSSHGKIYACSIYNDVTHDNSAINACDNSTVDIYTEQLIRAERQEVFIELSGNATVTINPLNDIIPINPVDEVSTPVKKTWPGMFNFKSGSKAVLKLTGHAIGTPQQVNALYLLKLFYIDGQPVDTRSKFSITYAANELTIKLKL